MKKVNVNELLAWRNGQHLEFRNAEIYGHRLSLAVSLTGRFLVRLNDGVLLSTASALDAVRFYNDRMEMLGVHTLPQ